MQQEGKRIQANREEEVENKRVRKVSSEKISVGGTNVKIKEKRKKKQ